MLQRMQNQNEQEIIICRNPKKRLTGSNDKQQLIGDASNVHNVKDGTFLNFTYDPKMQQHAIARQDFQNLRISHSFRKGYGNPKRKCLYQASRKEHGLSKLQWKVISYSVSQDIVKKQILMSLVEQIFKRSALTGTDMETIYMLDFHTP